IAAVWAVAKSPKFLRKGLWILLTLLNVSFGWTIGPGATVGVGIPIGALYVLWFWRFGRQPTAEQLARYAERRARGRAPTAASPKVLVLRGAYLAAVAATAVMTTLILTGGMEHIMVDDMGVPPSEFPPGFLVMIQYGDSLLAVALGGLFVFLS